jgi:hypothetical protein
MERLPTVSAWGLGKLASTAAQARTRNKNRTNCRIPVGRWC